MSLMDQRLEPQWRITRGEGRELGIGIVGCGGIVRYAHLPAYRTAGLKVLTVFDVDGDKARAVAEEFEIAGVAASADEVASTPGVSIVDIAVPPWEQPAIVARVAAAGRHMLCQKPLALTYADALAEVETAERAGVLMAVNQQMRWVPCVAAARSLVAQGAIGRLSGAQIQVEVATPWHMWPWLPAHRASRSSITASTTSTPSAPSWAIRCGSRASHGETRCVRAVAGETRTTTVLEYADGLQALVIVNHDNEHGTPVARISVQGETGAIEGTIGLLYDYPDGRVDTLALLREHAITEELDFEGVRWIPDAFLGPMGDLMDAVATNRQPTTAGRDNLGTMAVAMAAYRSAEERRSVRLDEITGPRLTDRRTGWRARPRRPFEGWRRPAPPRLRTHELPAVMTTHMRRWLAADPSNDLVADDDRRRHPRSCGPRGVCGGHRAVVLVLAMPSIWFPLALAVLVALGLRWSRWTVGTRCRRCGRSARSPAEDRPAPPSSPDRQIGAVVWDHRKRAIIRGWT